MDQDPFTVGEQLSTVPIDLMGKNVEQFLRKLQRFVVVCILIPQLLFFVFAFVFVRDTKVRQFGPAILGTWAFAGVCAGTILIAASFVVSRWVTDRKLRQVRESMKQSEDMDISQDKMLEVYREQLLTSLYILQSAAFLYLSLANAGQGLFPPGLSILPLILFVLKFPTRARVSRWVQVRHCRIHISV